MDQRDEDSMSSDGAMACVAAAQPNEEPKDDAVFDRAYYDLVVPDTLRSLQACTKCQMVMTGKQSMLAGGCSNCGHEGAVGHFSGLVALLQPDRGGGENDHASWVARVTRGAVTRGPGLYALDIKVAARAAKASAGRKRHDGGAGEAGVACEDDEQGDDDDDDFIDDAECDEDEDDARGGRGDEEDN